MGGDEQIQPSFPLPLPPSPSLSLPLSLSIFHTLTHAFMKSLPSSAHACSLLPSNLTSLCLLSLSARQGQEGVYLDDCNLTTDPSIIRPHAVEPGNAEKCWALSEKMVGQTFEYE